MKTRITFTAVIACAAFLFATSAWAMPAPAEKKDGMALLEEAHRLMGDLGDYLPQGDVGEKVQTMEQKIVGNFDELIRMILDQDAETIDSDSRDRKDPSDGSPGDGRQTNPQDVGKVVGGDDPADTAGGNDKGRPATTYGPRESGDTSKSWDSPLDDKYFGRTGDPKKSAGIPGYEEWIERFRKAVAREGARLPK